MIRDQQSSAHGEVLILAKVFTLLSATLINTESEIKCRVKIENTILSTTLFKEYVSITLLKDYTIMKLIHTSRHIP